MPEDKNEFGENRPDLETIKQFRLENSSGWLELSKSRARAILIDSLLDAPPGYEFTPPEIAPRAGITDQSVRNHIDILEEVGLVEKVDESRYQLNNESRVLMELEQLNSAVTGVRSGMSSADSGEFDPDEFMDNAKRDPTTGDSRDRGTEPPVPIVNAY
jgi:DNA-binding transcriptional ArsR family regulator